MDLCSSYEVGGGLFGFARGQTIFVEDAVPNPVAQRQERTRVQIDSDYLKRGERDFYSCRGLSWIGDWHTHPDYDSGQPNPSKADFRGWAAMRRTSPGIYVGLIMHPSLPHSDRPNDIDPWLFPRRSAWVVRAEERRIVVEPLEILAEVAHGN